MKNINLNKTLSYFRFLKKKKKNNMQASLLIYNRLPLASVRAN